MKNVPALWDEIRFIDGYPGKYLVMARRSGGKWYVAGINAEEKALKLDLQLPSEMVVSGEKTEVTVYGDDKNLAGSKRTIKTDKNGRIKVEIPCNGGVVVTK